MPASSRSMRSRAKSRRRGACGVLYELRLYVIDKTPRCAVALANLKRICEQYIAGQYRIEVVDLLKHPELARADQILAIPTLVRTGPPPVRTVIGSLSSGERVLAGLGLLTEDGHGLSRRRNELMSGRSSRVLGAKQRKRSPS